MLLVLRVGVQKSSYQKMEKNLLFLCSKEVVKGRKEMEEGKTMARSVSDGRVSGRVAVLFGTSEGRSRGFTFGMGVRVSGGVGEGDKVASCWVESGMGERRLGDGRIQTILY